MKGSGMAQRVVEYSCREEAIVAKRTTGRLIDIDLNEQAVRKQLQNGTCKFFHVIVSVGVAVIVSRICLVYPKLAFISLGSREGP